MARVNIRARINRLRAFFGNISLLIRRLYRVIRVYIYIYTRGVFKYRPVARNEN